MIRYVFILAAKDGKAGGGQRKPLRQNQTLAPLPGLPKDGGVV